MAFADKKKREKAERQDDIIAAAETLFFSQGYDDVTMDDIAKELGVNKALLYYYFKDKESLYFAVVLRGLKILDEMFKKKSGKGRTGLEKLTLGGQVYAEFAKKHPDYFQAYNYVLSKRFDLGNTENNETLQKIIDIRRETFVYTCVSVQEGISDGTIRPNVVPVEIAILFGMIFDSFSKMTPQQIEILESHGIDQHKFMVDSRDLLDYMIVNDKTG